MNAIQCDLAGFPAPKSVIPWLAGFAAARRPATERTKGNPSRFQVLTGGFTTATGGLLDLPQRPSRPSQC